MKYQPKSNLAPTTPILKKAVNAVVKNVTQIPLFSNQAEKQYQEKVASFSARLEAVPDGYQKILEDLNREGVHVSSLQDLDLDNSEELLEECYKNLTYLESCLPENKWQYVIGNDPNDILPYLDIYLWGLQTKLLNLVENYLELPAAYHGIYLRRDLANGVSIKSRLWHTDKEDRRMVKIIIYLNDVDDSNGAFQFIPRRFSDRISRKLRYNHGYVKDRVIEKIIPRSEWVSCTGSPGTIIFVDTAKAFHRGQIPLASDRFSLFFDYTSRFPLRPYYCKPSFSGNSLGAVSPYLSSRQKDCVFWNPQLKKSFLLN